MPSGPRIADFERRRSLGTSLDHRRLPTRLGKSTAYGQASIDAPAGSIWIINPDLLAQRIADHERVPLLPDANIAAVTRIETWLYASVAAHQTVGVETVLSTPKYRALVDRAHAEGFAVRLIYVFLQTAQLNVERVRQRVKQGGHDVAEPPSATAAAARSSSWPGSSSTPTSCRHLR